MPRIGLDEILTAPGTELPLRYDLAPDTPAITIATLAKAINRSRQVVYRAIKTHKLVAYKRENETVTTEKAIADWLNPASAKAIVETCIFQERLQKELQIAATNYIRPWLIAQKTQVNERDCQAMLDKAVDQITTSWMENPTTDPSKIRRTINFVFAEIFD